MSTLLPPFDAAPNQRHMAPPTHSPCLCCLSPYSLLFLTLLSLSSRCCLFSVFSHCYLFSVFSHCCLSHRLRCLSPSALCCLNAHAQISSLTSAINSEDSDDEVPISFRLRFAIALCCSLFAITLCCSLLPLLPLWFKSFWSLVGSALCLTMILCLIQ